jgi:hypothetical protein
VSEIKHRTVETNGTRKPDTLKDISIEAELHNERLITHFNGQGMRTLFQPTRIIMETEGGRFVDSRDDPRSAFRGHTRETPWDDLDVAYFNSYALWNYLTIPFVYTYPGFVTEELGVESTRQRRACRSARVKYE